MPLKLSVGTSKKVGQRNFGSLGASCALEVELDASLLQGDLDAFHQHVRNAFAACRQAVHYELARHQQSATSPSSENQGNGQSSPANGNGSRRSNGRQATSSQVRAIHAIANRQRVDLPHLLRDRFGVDRAEDLSISDASSLIDELKGQASEAGGRR